MNSNISFARGQLWRGHPATPEQTSLVFEADGTERRSQRVTQADVMLEMLRQARAIGNRLGLPEIQELRIAQHSARFAELRERGHVITNTMRRNDDGRIISEYALEYDVEGDGLR